MKSRKNSQNDRIDTPKAKKSVTSTRTANVAGNSSKSSTNIYLKKNLSILETYTNLFGQQNPSHIGDAETHFRKSLRKYSEFNYKKNTGWIKPKGKDIQIPIKKPKKIQIEQEQASGDSPKSINHKDEETSARSAKSPTKSSNYSECQSPLRSEYLTISESNSDSQLDLISRTSSESINSLINRTFHIELQSRSANNSNTTRSKSKSQFATPRGSSSRPESERRPRTPQIKNSKQIILVKNKSKSSSSVSPRPLSSRFAPEQPQQQPRLPSRHREAQFVSISRSQSEINLGSKVTVLSNRSKSTANYLVDFTGSGVESVGDSQKFECSLHSVSFETTEGGTTSTIMDGGEEADVIITDVVPDEGAGGEAVEDEPPADDDDFKKLLDKSLEELKQAAEDLDAAALQELGEETVMMETIGDTKDESASRAIVPIDNKVLMELEQAELQARSTANIINELKAAVATLLNKEHMTDKEAKELEELNKALMKHMEDFEAKTKLIQILVKFADDNLKPITNLPPIQEKQPEDMLPKVLVCGITEDNMPRIIICDADKKKRRPRTPSTSKPRTSSTKAPRTSSTSPPRPSVDVAKRLSESYDMQEKLALDNVALEDKRYQLQECLLNKDKTCENLQRRVTSLQAEMRILSRENTVLNEKLAKVQGKCRPKPELPCGGGRGVCPADVENRLHHYSQTTSALEKQVEMMENEVRRMQDELVAVQRDRMELEAQRKAAVEAAQAAQMAALNRPSAHTCRSTCHGPCGRGPSQTEQQLRELREQYNRLQDDFKAKVTEVAGLRADNEKLKCCCKDLEGLKAQADVRAEELEREMRKSSDEKNKLMGSKEMLIEQEQQLIVAKQRFREAQDELEETRALIGDQAAQLEDYRNKYLQAQQLVEEQRRQIDMMELENNRVSEQVAVEIQRVKTQFQEKLSELSPLPDILKNTQLKLQEETQLRILAERNAEAISRELQMAKDKENALLNDMDKVRSDQILNEDERAAMMNKVNNLECKCGEAQNMVEKLKQDLARSEEIANQREKRLDEKLHEITQLTAQLENVREESARQVARTKDRCETVRRSMQGQIADLERQLAAARAMARSAQKDRDDIRQRMQAQINNLNENFEEAQLRIRSLQGHVNFLKTSYTNMFGADSSGDDGCDCGNFN